jgi:hypothetical protein
VFDGDYFDGEDAKDRAYERFMERAGMKVTIEKI